MVWLKYAFLNAMELRHPLSVQLVSEYQIRLRFGFRFCEVQVVIANPHFAFHRMATCLEPFPAYLGKPSITNLFRHLLHNLQLSQMEASKVGCHSRPAGFPSLKPFGAGVVGRHTDYPITKTVFGSEVHLPNSKVLDKWIELLQHLIIAGNQPVLTHHIHTADTI